MDILLVPNLILSSIPEDLMSLLAIVCSVVSIIALICFFSLCKDVKFIKENLNQNTGCDANFSISSDVSKIKNHLIQNTDFEAKFNFLMMIGEKEKAREILINRILSNPKIFSEDAGDANSNAKMCYDVYSKEFAALGVENPFKEE
ncbi:MAG: hypothetical protein J5629_11515 [Muribaculaceae bacterium]|nr:hypothetical protein [Muribaculaceae bacterium]